MLLHTSRFELILAIVKAVSKEIFKVSLVSFLLFYLINDFFPGFVSDYFNLTILIYITIITGTLSIWLGVEKTESNEQAKHVSKKEYIFISILSMVSIILIFYRIHSIGKLSYFISILSGIIIFLLSLLIKEDNNEPQDEQ